MSGKKTWFLLLLVLIVITSFSILSVGRTPKALAASNTLDHASVTSTSVQTLILPFDGSFPVSGNSYGCGDHLDYAGTKYHDAYAIDFGLPTGTPVVAVAGGYAYSGSDGATTNYGNYVWIQHPGGFVSVYAHLSNIYIQQGMWVPQGWHIADSGYSGHVYPPGPAGAHLHFSFRKNATSISDGVPAIPEPMSGYRGFKYYGDTAARSGAPNNCQAIDTSTRFNSANSMTRQTLLAMEFPLLGISYRSSDNNNPNPNWDWVNVQVYNTSNIQVANIWNNNVYNSIPGAFVDFADLGPNFPAGIYYARIRMNNTLSQVDYGINIVQGLETFVPLQTITVAGINAVRAGDIDNNNQLDILDYNDLISCFNNKPCNFHNQADLNRDGSVTGVDYTIWLRYDQGY